MANYERGKKRRDKEANKKTLPPANAVGGKIRRQTILKAKLLSLPE